MSSKYLACAREYGVTKALEAVGYASAEELIKEAQVLGLTKEARLMSPGSAGVLGTLVGNYLRPGYGMATGPLAAALSADEGHALGAAAGQLAGTIGGGVGGQILGSMAGQRPIAKDILHSGLGAEGAEGIARGGKDVGGLVGGALGGYGLANQWGLAPTYQ